MDNDEKMCFSQPDVLRIGDATASQKFIQNYKYFLSISAL
jgi:hypothetical protein